MTSGRNQSERQQRGAVEDRPLVRKFLEAKAAAVLPHARATHAAKGRLQSLGVFHARVDRGTARRQRPEEPLDLCTPLGKDVKREQVRADAARALDGLVERCHGDHRQHGPEDLLPEQLR
eukprot:scaffold26249_cov48-Phaeocystis_antarctica.AAC.1